ncbi:MAG: MurR/RpiR family transcriptional regulator [Devosia sp.]|nr:MurR/RpiR family transcriptional regulator [Devosia sp.]
MTIVVDIVDLINGSMRSLRESEQQVATVVLADQQFATTASTTELAKRANVSATSITRFCRALGFKGLREFKLCVAQNLAVNAHFMANSVVRTDSFSELVASLTGALTTALSDINSDLSPTAFPEALDIIASARHVSVLPVDQWSQGIALDAHVRLLRMGIESSVHFAVEEQRMMAGIARETNALIVIAADGGNPDLADLIDLVGIQDAGVILIAPSLNRGQAFSGTHLVVRNSSPVEMFAQSAVRYRQSIIIDILCTGHSLNLSEGLAERRRQVEQQVPPPLKREET